MGGYEAYNILSNVSPISPPKDTHVHLCMCVYTEKARTKQKKQMETIGKSG